MHRNSQMIFEAYGRSYFKKGMKILEIGPDGNPSSFQKLVNIPEIRWETLDLVDIHKPTHLVNEEYTFPLADNSYDLIVSANVIEHVRKIWTWMKELTRICKSGGVLITVCPLSWPFHEYPVDCWRIYPEGMKALYEEAGLKTEFVTCENLELLGSREGGPFKGIKIQDFTEAHVRSLGFRKVCAGMADSLEGYKPHLKKIIGWPISVAFDTLIVGKKPG